MTDNTELWVIAAGGDGYEGRLVEGWAALEIALLEMTEGGTARDTDSAQAMLTWLNDDDEWNGGAEHFSASVSFEDGWLHIHKVTRPPEPQPEQRK